MTTRSRTTATAALVGAALLLAAGCGNNAGSTAGPSTGTSTAGGGGGGGGVTELTMLTGFTGPDKPSYDALISLFNTSHPNIHVTMTAQPWATVGQKLPASWATAQGPDLATPSSDPGSIFQYIKTNAAAPLTSAVGTGNDKINAAAFPASVRSAFTVDGQLHAVPANVATLVLYYNKKLFTQAGITAAPTTEAEFIADAKKLTIGSGKPTQYGLSLADHETIQMWPILQWMSGGDIIDAKGCATVNSAASVAALTTWGKLVSTDHISPVGQAGADADTLFSAGKAAMEINGPWAADGFRTAGIDLGIAQVPVGSAGPVTLGSTVPLMIEKSTRHMTEAQQFLAWWTSKTAQTTFSTKSGFPPARTDLTTGLTPTAATFAAALPHARLYLAGQSSATAIDTDVYIPMIQKITRGSDVQQTTAAAATSIDKLTSCSTS